MAGSSNPVEADPVAAVLAGLDGEQRAAVVAPAGRVCILAGAGTGKTRAITHRIAYRVLTGEIQARHVLAVTFTARAAAQMRGRLAELGVAVQARTFHAAALRQLRYFAERLLNGRALPEVVESKARLVGLAAARSGIRTDRTGARDLASEIEWAKSSLVEPGDYVQAAAKAVRETPHDAAKVAEVYAAYEQVKRAPGVIDFEDLLRAAVWGIEEHPDVADQVRAQYRHFVVDEYQDVNPAQQRLLLAWLGGRDDLTVVGDASQTIYSFTGATSSTWSTSPVVPGRGRWNAGPAGTRLPVHTAGGRPRQPGHQAGRWRRGPAAPRAGGSAPAGPGAGDPLPCRRADRGGRGGDRCAELIGAAPGP